MVVMHLDWMAAIKAVLPPESVLSGEAPQERREETVSSDANRAASISGVLPFLVFGCKETVIIVMLDDYDEDFAEDLLLKRGEEKECLKW